MTPQTPGERIVRLEAEVATLKAFIPQWTTFMQEIRTFVDTHRATELERERVMEQRHKENSAKLQNISNTIGKKSLWTAVAGLAVAAAGVAVAILAIYVTVQLSHRSASDIMQMLHSAHRQVLADRLQLKLDAGNPPY